MIDKIKKNKELCILICIMVFSSIWVLKSGMPYQHDISFHFSRLFSLSNTLKSGDFFALIHDAFYGYGYATGIFYGNFFFYVPAFLVLLGMPVLSAYKIFYILINIITTLTIYFCVKSITKDKKTSIISTVLYMFANYRIMDTFVRGAVGEMLAFMIVPIIILGLYEIVYRDYKKWYYFTIGFVLLVLAHLISTFILAIFIVIFLVCNYKEFLKEKVRIKYLIISGVVGLGLGAFFLLPMLEQRLYGNIEIFEAGSIFLLKDYIVSFKDFIVPTNIFNTFIGYSLIILLPIRYFIKKNYKYSEKDIRFADIFLILGIIAWVSTTAIIPWSKLQNYLYFVQFPWRLLFISTVFMIFSYAIYYKILISNKKPKKDWKIIKKLYILAIIISIIDISYYSIQFGFRRNRYLESETDHNSIGGGEYLIYNTDVTEFSTINYKLITNNPDIVIQFNKNGTSMEINYENNNSKDTFIELPLLNYYGYKAKGAKLVNSSNNLIRVLPEGERGTIKVKYEMTTIQKSSYLVSFVFMIGTTAYIIIEKRKK